MTPPRFVLPLLLAASAALPPLACSRADAERGAKGSVADRGAPRRAAELVVRRGDFDDRFLLTGELDASRADAIAVPYVPFWPVTIRWLEADGTDVEKGQKVVELDNAAFTTTLETKRLAAVEARHALEKARADARVAIGEATFTLESKRVALEKAEAKAKVPPEIQPKRDYQEKQLAFERARSQFDSATADLEAARTGSAADVEVRRLALEKTNRELATAESAIEALIVRAPREGILVMSDHPWEGRRFQIGDQTWVGMILGRIPDLPSLQVVAALPDVDDGEVRVGQRAMAYLDTYPGLAFPARIAEVGPVAQEAAGQSLRRSFRVVAALERVDVEKMRPGLSVRLVVERDARKGVLLVARAALDRDAKPPRAIRADGRPVELGLGPCNAQECVVLSGAREGDRLRPIGLSDHRGEARGTSPASVSTPVAKGRAK